MRMHFLSATTAQRLLLPATVFLLICGLTACDLPGGKATSKQAAVTSEADILAIDSFSSRTPQTSLAAINADSYMTAFTTPASSVRLPPVEDMQLTPLEQAGDPAGNAMLSVRFREDSDLPDVLPLLVDNDQFVFRRDSADRFRFNGMVRFDFDGFLREQESRISLIAETKATGATIFDGRNAIAEEKFEFIDPAVIQRARVTSTA